MAELKKTSSPAAVEQTSETSLLDQMILESRVGKETGERQRRKDLIGVFIEQVTQGDLAVSKDTEAMINARIAQIDHLVSLQLNQVMHAPEFQKLEGTWRGLRYLIQNSETSDNLKIKVLNV